MNENVSCVKSPLVCTKSHTLRPAREYLSRATGYIDDWLSRSPQRSFAQ